MPNLNETLAEIQEAFNAGDQAALDTVRGKYLKLVAAKTGRNTIAYYSGWLQKSGHEGVILNDKDKSAFMANIHRMDRTRGLDLILHTPGGEIAATESLVDYLFSMFGNDIRAIIPQLSMSAGTMIALSCKEIMMGKQSNLGPIDPQMGGIACQAVIDEFETAKKDVRENPNSAALWQVIIAKYHPTFIGSCRYAIEWSEQLVHEWLMRNMCGRNKTDADRILREFSDHSKNKSHSRHISKDQCKAVGVKVIDMESDQDLQDLILTTHHAFMHAFNHSQATKIVENDLGMIYVEQAKPQP